MAITLAEAKAQLNITWPTDDTELQLYVDAANEWVAAKVPDQTKHPNLVNLATRLLVADWWQTQRGPGGTPLGGDELVPIAGRGYAIPNFVKEMLEPDFGSSIGAPQGAFPDADCYWPDPWSTGPYVIQYGR